ncbi:amino acid ABC transporter permease [Mobilibacterium timonense]|uniref:amino acid ABC transporter permease n=1 Tax=Mobilibacterium timonense TaxID=1871012 RepID=UPI0009859720|nr:amino acid ABC transporter permease [Mobilibacterium timonense]MBM6991371.1 amino acid ABC transporter permease [Mobilibacterium timonense]
MAMYWKGFLIACQGIPATVAVSLIAVIIGAIIGLFLALLRLANNTVLRTIAKIYIDVVRGTPMVVQAFIFAYGIPQLLQANNVEFRWDNLVIPAVIVCGLNSAAYMAEIVRSGIQAVDKGQMEAARSLGMSKSMAMRLIIIPQAVKVILPAVGNEFVTLIKETSVLSFVGVVEVMRRGALWNAATFETFPAYIGVALVYMLLTIPLSKIIGHVEGKMRHEEAA